MANTSTPTKRVPARPKLKKFLTYLDEGDHEQLRRIGFETHRSIASLVREAVRDYLTKQRRKQG